MLIQCKVPSTTPHWEHKLVENLRVSHFRFRLVELIYFSCSRQWYQWYTYGIRYINRRVGFQAVNSNRTERWFWP